ncbi:MAG: redox-sensing transcriptional repressor Rex [Elusimicrobiota bacterium]
MNKNNKKIPSIVIPRLSRYYRVLYEYVQDSWISSKQLSGNTGFSAAQIRRDLTYFGQFGIPGRGYKVDDLKKSIKNILGLDNKWNVALIGVGNLGRALLGYRGFIEQGFEIVAAFDVDKSKVGRRINKVQVYDISEIPHVIKENGISIAILTVPENVAQLVAEKAAAAGVKAVLNFASGHLKLPETVKQMHIDITIEIERLSFLISRDLK